MVFSCGEMLGLMEYVCSVWLANTHALRDGLVLINVCDIVRLFFPRADIAIAGRADFRRFSRGPPY